MAFSPKAVRASIASQDLKKFSEEIANSEPNARLAQRKVDLTGAVNLKGAKAKAGSKSNPRQVGGPRELLHVNGKERPILLETRELERPRLDGLIGELKDYRAGELALELDRQEKLRSVNGAITDLKYKRLSYSLEVWGGADPPRGGGGPSSARQSLHSSSPRASQRPQPTADAAGSSFGRSMQPITWREVNQAKARQNKADVLHDVSPQERVTFLRAMESAVRDDLSRRKPARHRSKASVSGPSPALSPKSDMMSP